MNELEIHGLSVNGEGIGRLADGRVVFVQDAIPGDRVRVRFAETRKRVQYAELVEILVASPDRESGQCMVDGCGGCALRNTSRALQSRIKRQAVADAMRRIGGMDVEAMLGAVHTFGDGWTNRHRVRLHAAWAGGGWQLGYYERGSRKLVPLSTCRIAWPELEALALSTARELASLPQEARIEEVEMAYSRRDARGAAKITSSGSLVPFRRSIAWLDATQLSGIEIEASDGRWRHGNLELRYDHRRADEFDLRYEPGLFTQAFPEANDALVDFVLQAVRPRTTPRVLELHAGIGNFSVPMARAGAAVVAYERNRRAAVLCQRNGRAPGLQLEVRPDSDTAALADIAHFDALLMDPPRTGAKEVAAALRDKGPERVVYVSCDPATLARDVAMMAGGGYQIESIDAFDMFPQTTHVETIAVLSRKRA